MAASSPSTRVAAFPKTGTEGERVNHLREAMRSMKREAIDDAMGKGESWSRKILNEGVGIPLDEIPRLLSVLGLQLVGVNKAVVDREVVQAMATIHAKLAPHLTDLLWREADAP